MKPKRKLISAGAIIAIASVAGFGCALDPVSGPVNPVDPPADTPDAGDGETPVEGSEATKSLFINNAAPAVVASCGGATCHNDTASPLFVVDNREQMYTNVRSNYAANLSTNGIGQEGFQPTDTKLLSYLGAGHSNRASMTPEQQQAVTTWLLAEQTEALNGGGAVEVISPLSIFSGCMDLNEFKEAGVANAWANKNAAGEGRCEACHNRAAYHFMATEDDDILFNYITTAVGIASYFTIDSENPQSVMINRPRLLAAGSRQAPHQQHGDYDIDENPMQRLENFYNLTMEKFNEPNRPRCQAPRF